MVNQVHLFSSGDARCNMFPLGPCFQVQLKTKILTVFNYDAYEQAGLCLDQDYAEK
jgi:hypothetical protein